MIIFSCLISLVSSMLDYYPIQTSSHPQCIIHQLRILFGGYLCCSVSLASSMPDILSSPTLTPHITHTHFILFSGDRCYSILLTSPCLNPSPPAPRLPQQVHCHPSQPLCITHQHNFLSCTSRDLIYALFDFSGLSCARERITDCLQHNIKN